MTKKTESTTKGVQRMHVPTVHAPDATTGTTMTRRSLVRRLAAVGLAASIGGALATPLNAALAAPVHPSDAIAVTEIPFLDIAAVDGRTEVWYSYKAGKDNFKQLMASTYGSDYDTMLFMYLNNTLIGQNDDNGENGQSEFRFDVAPGGTYYFKVVQFSNYSFGEDVPAGITLNFRLFPLGLG